MSSKSRTRTLPAAALAALVLLPLAACGGQRANALDAPPKASIAVVSASRQNPATTVEVFQSQASGQNTGETIPVPDGTPIQTVPPVVTAVPTAPAAPVAPAATPPTVLSSTGTGHTAATASPVTEPATVTAPETTAAPVELTSPPSPAASSTVAPPTAPVTTAAPATTTPAPATPVKIEAEDAKLTQADNDPGTSNVEAVGYGSKFSGAGWVTHFSFGDKIAWTVSGASAAAKATFHVTAPFSNNAELFTVEVDGRKVGTLTVDPTVAPNGDWTNWSNARDVTVDLGSLSAGSHTVTVYRKANAGSGVNFDYVTVVF